MKILIAPHEICGQMGILAQAMREIGYDAMSISYYRRNGARVYVTDRNLGIVSGQRTTKDNLRQLHFALSSTKSFDVFHFFFGESLLPRLVDLPLLRILGKRVFVHFRGSDITKKSLRIRAQKAMIADSLSPDATLPWSSEIQLKRLFFWRKYADALFVSTPNLLHVVPDAILVPQAINLAQWHFIDRQYSHHFNEIVIAHAPTDREIKGTSYVIDAVKQLQIEGMNIRLELLENMPPQQVKERLKKCHICIDEVLQGNYGNVSIECMALGMPVIARLDPIYEKVCPDLPIVNADPNNLISTLRRLVQDHGLRQQLRIEGRKFVERWHDSRVIAKKLIDIYRCN